MIKLTIGLAPVSKKNSARIFYKVTPNGKVPFIMPSKAYKEYEKNAGWFIHPPIKPIDYPVNVKMTFYMPTRRRVDLVNLEEACLDVLTKYGMLSDDNNLVVFSMDGSGVRYDKENPRTEIVIERVIND